MSRRAYLFIAIAFTAYYVFTLSGAAHPLCIFRVAGILDGTEVSPFVYRVLTPLILAALGNSPYAHLGFTMFMFAAFFVLLDLWLQRWRVSAAGLLLVAVILPQMFESWYCSPYAVTEAVLFLCGLLLLTARCGQKSDYCYLL